MARAEAAAGTWDEYEYRYILNGGTADVEDALYAETPAWHGKGRIHEDGGIPFEVAMLDPALNWEVETRPIYTLGADGQPVEVPESFATVRKSDDSPLGVVGNRYTPIQNSEGFRWIEALVDGGDLQIEAVLSLRGGRTVAIEARRPEHITIGGEEVIPYVLFTNTHDGRGPAQMLATDERTVCRNTLRFALKGAKNTYKVRHLKNSRLMLAEARTALQVGFNYTEELKALGEELLTVSFSDNDLSNFLDSLVEVPEPVLVSDEKGGFKVGNQRTIDGRRQTQIEIHDLYKTADNLNDIRGTAWGALNAVVEYEEYSRKYKTDDRRIEAILNVDNRNQRALEILTN